MQVLTGGLFLTKPPKQAFVQEETVDIANVENEQQAQALRKAQRIRVYGTDVPLPITKFAHFKQPTPIQMQAIPILGRGRDLIACAPTGSGKTLAYLFPIEKILLEYGGIGAVILTPTRELASQVEREYNNYDFKMHAAVLSKHVDKRCQIIISTPKRLIDAVKKGTFSLDKVKYLVLDEADKLLDLGFLEQIDDILSLCTSTRLQKALFSATIPSGVEQLAKTIMVDPLRIVIGQQYHPPNLETQRPRQLTRNYYM